MRPDNDEFWNEMGVSWRASIRDAGSIASGLDAHLRRQKTLLAVATILGAAVSLLGFCLAAWTIWIGWSSHVWNFLSRGATLAAVSLLAAAATLALRARSGAESRSLREMLWVSTAHTERLIRAADLMCFAVAVLAIGGTVGYVIKTRFGSAPAASLIADFLALALAGLALVWYRQGQVRALGKFRRLSEAFGSESELQ
ncbi:MAG TPA: hypothetical protein VGI93_22510 [Steroidobacteraceae bacterium]